MNSKQEKHEILLTWLPALPGEGYERPISANFSITAKELKEELGPIIKAKVRELGRSDDIHFIIFNQPYQLELLDNAYTMHDLHSRPSIAITTRQVYRDENDL